MTTLSIHPIEDALAERGLVTEYIGTDDFGIYTITGDGKEIEIFEAVSLDSFTSENVVEAVLYGNGAVLSSLTEAFEGVETVEEFLAVVAEALT